MPYEFPAKSARRQVTMSIGKGDVPVTFDIEVIDDTARFTEGGKRSLGTMARPITVRWLLTQHKFNTPEDAVRAFTTPGPLSDTPGVIAEVVLALFDELGFPTFPAKSVRREVTERVGKEDARVTFVVEVIDDTERLTQGGKVALSPLARPIIVRWLLTELRFNTPTDAVLAFMTFGPMNDNSVAVTPVVRALFDELGFPFIKPY